MALWGGLGQAATVAQLVGADIGGLITMIMQAAMTAQQNKEECEQLPAALAMAGRQAEKFRDVQSRIDSYLLLFPVISHMDITRRLDRIYNILVPNDMAGPAMSPVSMPQFPDAAKMYWKEPHGVQEFSFNELAKATNNFAPERKIGEGGFGSVYMGRLPDGRVVAIKHRCRNSDQGMEVFMHIVPLYGYCDVLVEEKQRRLLPPFRKEKEEKEHLLVYEYMENGSLDHHLHGPTSSSSSSPYLQSCGEQPIIHRDIKTSNILLDGNWVPRLTDFGYAFTWEGPGTDINVLCGTMGYMAPEYLMTWALNPTIDIYSFGVVMLEVLTGKKPYLFKEEWKEEKREKCEQDGKNTEEDKEESEREEEEKTTEEQHEWQKRDGWSSGHSLASLTPLIEAGEVWKVLDRRPAAEPTARQLEAAELVAQTAARCLRLRWEERPAISEVVANLEKALELVRCDG
ncbi:hypothetical protein DAI22_11g224000 [Oryza sativa Japonica Group]|nr:hypothetical protein DAI22_11g224000 [Oryza sativa Japonica Group]